MSDDIEHPHCDSCYWRKCLAVTDPPCAVISCNNFCGASFHECKSAEHRELCLLEKVRCINEEYGCPLVLLRRDLSQHLSVCPASVVCCTMEWCRWPMYSREHGTSVQSAQTNLRARCAQLDVALALRDQRSLDRARKFPRRSLVRSLRNRFTKRHPTVPLLVGGNPTFVGEDEQNLAEVEFSDSEDDAVETNSRAPWLTSEPPGLKKSILSELFGELPTKPTVTENVANLVAEDIRCALCSKAGSATMANGHLCLAASSDTDAASCTCFESEHEAYSEVCNDDLYVESKNLSTLLSRGSKTSQESGLADSLVSNEGAFKMAARSEVQETNYADNVGVPTAKENNNNNVTDNSCPAGISNQIGLTDATHTGNKTDEAAAATSVKSSECYAVDSIVQ